MPEVSGTPSNVRPMMRIKNFYEVARHRFSLSADIEDFGLMENYEPFLVDGAPDAEQISFDLSIEEGHSPAYTEELRQVEEDQTIICGKTSDGSPLYAFQWCDKTAGWLICSADYRAGRLITTGRYKKLAIDNALMVMYALATADRDTVLFHAAVVSHQGKGYMFIAPSGTGKSTHAQLWMRHIADTELVNDDNPVVRIGEEGEAMVYGSPWSGKTPCYRSVGYPLGGIVKLSRAPFNKICRLNGLQGYAALMASISGKRWDKRIADGLHATENRLAGNIPIWHMQCLPDKEAAEVCESSICNNNFQKA